MLDALEQLIENLNENTENTLDELEEFLDIDKNEIFRPIKGIGETIEFSVQEAIGIV
jgi:hypothetical protein